MRRTYVPCLLLALAVLLAPAPAAADTSSHVKVDLLYFKTDGCTGTISTALRDDARDVQVVQPKVGDSVGNAHFTDVAIEPGRVTWTAEQSSCGDGWPVDVRVKVRYRARSGEGPGGHHQDLPKLTEKTAKFYATKALKQNRNLKYRSAYDKKFRHCHRLSRTRIRCTASFEVNPFHAFKGPITIWLTRNGLDHRLRFHYDYNLRHYDPACVHDGHSIKQCTWH